MDGLLIGRFQPLHLGHLAAIKEALGRADRLWLAIGSSDSALSPKNPFTAAERQEMIESSLLPEHMLRTRIFLLPDYNDHARWLANVDRTVPPYQIVFTHDPMMGRLYGDRPVTIAEIPFTDRQSLSGTGIREGILGGEPWESLVPGGARRVLERIGARGRLQSVQRA